MSTATDSPWTVVEAITPKGVPLVLVSDDTGDYFIVEQLAFRGAEPHLSAHKIGPGDRLKPGTQRFAVLTEQIPND